MAAPTSPATHDEVYVEIYLALESMQRVMARALNAFPYEVKYEADRRSKPAPTRPKRKRSSSPERALSLIQGGA